MAMSMEVGAASGDASRRMQPNGSGPNGLDVPAIELDHVTVRFPGASRPSLQDVSVKTAKNELLVLVGESGSGKTTILNLVAGLLNPSSGTVLTLGVPPAAARSNVSYMFARDALMPWRNAQRNVELGLEILKIPKEERQRRAVDMLGRLGLSDAARKHPWQLSQGMRQRVALARTWVRAPKLLLMDEPFSALDAMTRATAQQEFIRLWNAEASPSTVLLVTHDLTEALLLGDRIVMLSRGRIIREFAVPFERPRDDLESLRTSREFVDLERDLAATLHHREAE